MTNAERNSARWVAADWGTSHLRLWPMGKNDAPLCRIDSGKGMSSLKPAEYEPALLDLLQPYLQGGKALEVICCGMAGSRQGWAEAPYAAAPCVPPSFATATLAPVRDARVRVHILSGVKQSNPADVMRGEETQIAGVLAQQPGFDGVICLPGTHTKWVSVQNGEITGFATFLSGELFQLASEHSVLRHTLSRKGWDTGAFEAGCREGAASPERLANALFGLRAGALLNGLDPVAARSRASGYIIGMETAAMRDEWLDRPVVIVGENEIAQAYASALNLHGARAQVADAETVTLAGLCAAYAAMK